jgi:uncharacterized membrane protein
VDNTIDLLARLSEFFAVVLIATGIVVTFVRVLLMVRGSDRRARFERLRVELGGAVIVGLDVLLAAAVLQAAVEPSGATAGRLGVVAALRVGLSLLILGEVAAYRGGPRDDPNELVPQAVNPAAKPVLHDDGEEVHDIWTARARLGGGQRRTAV